MDGASLRLEGAGDAEERRGIGEEGVSFEHRRPEDDVHEPGLVLKRHGGDALGGSRRLAANDEAGGVAHPPVSLSAEPEICQ